MIKAKATSIAGRPVYILGLSAQNLKLIRQNQPIRVDGAEIQLPDTWFIVAWIRHGEDAKTYQKHFSTPGKPARVFGLTHEGLDKLEKEGCIVYPADMLKLDGDVYLLYGETEAILAKEVLALTVPEAEQDFAWSSTRSPE